MDCKCLSDLTENVSIVGKKLKGIPEKTVRFLREFNKCIRKGFISWIKEIIKGKCSISLFYNDYNLTNMFGFFTAFITCTNYFDKP